MQRLKDIPNTPEGLLVRLKLKLCEQMKISPAQLRSYVENFVNNMFALKPGPKTSFVKVNINNELTKNRMTIKVFFKFLEIIKVKRASFSVTVTTFNDIDLTVTEEVDFEEIKKENKKISDEAGKLLIKLKNKICEAMEISNSDLRVYIDHFVNNIFLGTNSSKINFAKVNISNELMKDRMTIKVFFKFLSIINIKQVIFTVSVITKKGLEANVNETIYLQLATSPFGESCVW